MVFGMIKERKNSLVYEVSNNGFGIYKLVIENM